MPESGPDRNPVLTGTRSSPDPAPYRTRIRNQFPTGVESGIPTRFRQALFRKVLNCHYSQSFQPIWKWRHGLVYTIVFVLGKIDKMAISQNVKWRFQKFSKIFVQHQKLRGVIFGANWYQLGPNGRTLGIGISAISPSILGLRKQFNIHQDPSGPNLPNWCDSLSKTLILIPQGGNNHFRQPSEMVNGIPFQEFWSDFKSKT